MGTSHLIFQDFSIFDLESSNFHQRDLFTTEFDPRGQIGFNSAHWVVILKIGLKLVKIIKKPNFHAIALIFGLWIAGCELLTDFD